MGYFIGQAAKYLLSFIICCMIFVLLYTYSGERDSGVDCFSELKIHESKRNRPVKGSCSEEASLSSDNQRVISYSFLNYNHSGYWKGFNEIIQNISVFYPGWQVRIYASGHDIAFLKTVVKKMDFAYYCDIDNLPPPLTAISKSHLMTWRFAPLGDPQVDFLMSRDSDSPILQREADAVSEWLGANKSLHIMRDNPHHGVDILGGAWGLKMSHTKKEELRSIRDNIFQSMLFHNRKGVDQEALKHFLLPAYMNDVLAHDCYLCKMFPGSSPWPTQRSADMRYVGSPEYRAGPHPSIVSSPCPLECRPKNHQDWEYC